MNPVVHGHAVAAVTDATASAPTLRDGDLRAAVARLARVPQLLVACDYDGTIAPIVDHPELANPLPEAIAALRALTALPQTHVAVISGRALRDLALLSRLPVEVHLVGSHGTEFDVGFVHGLAPELHSLRSKLLDELLELTRGQPGVHLEMKPASIAVHTRRAEPQVSDQVTAALTDGPATWPGIHTTIGKKVVELSVVGTNKGYALDRLRSEFGANNVLFLGDDITDEGAFAHLGGHDVGIKIGAGETLAGYRVADPESAVRTLAFLLETRRRWLFGGRDVPIERHSMLSNGHHMALVTPNANVTWLCHPRPDSSAVFAYLLGGDGAGHFRVRPQRDGLPKGQRYRPGTMTVETSWPTLTVTDFLDRPSSGTTLVRILEGTGPTLIEFAPRPEFGQVSIQLRPTGDKLVVVGSNEPIELYAPGVAWNVVDDGGQATATGVVDLAAHGGRLVIELRCGASDRGPFAPDVAAEQLAEAESDWLLWAGRLKLPDTARELVLRSALTLRGLCYQPTGAILAAATTSLPEAMGGVRNWDYRYCWFRDAAMTAEALVSLGSTAEAEALLGWVHRAVENTGGHPELLHPIYTIDGLELGPEAVIDTLPGYAGSRPVRVGNAANRQVQLDVFGPIMSLVETVVAHRGLTDADVRLTEAMVSAVARRWHEPDHGIWELRMPPRHHVYSKVMCWLTVDRAVRIADAQGLPVRPEWTALRDQIADNVLDHGWHHGVGAYTVAYGDPEMDASSLWIGLSGLLPDDDPRFLATVLKVEHDLRSGPTVYRYLCNDGLPGREGGFHLCTAWLIEAYLRTGRHADARELFQQMIACAGPTGLLPEQYDAEHERGLGNHPQGYSHLGLIRCAVLLDRANAR